MIRLEVIKIDWKFVFILLLLILLIGCYNGEVGICFYSVIYIFGLGGGEVEKGGVVVGLEFFYSNKVR